MIIGAAFGPRQMQNGAQILRAVFLWSVRDQILVGT
jgi:hypothetical protein